MGNANYNCTFTVKNTPQEVSDSICNVNEWWGNTEGGTTRQNDEFIYRVGTTWVEFKITEMIPGKRIVWQATDCELPWLKDKKEWKGTSVTFDISTANGETQVSMTHVGLTPQVECYEDCKAGWNHFAGNSLKNLITTGKGILDKQKVVQ